MGKETHQKLDGTSGKGTTTCAKVKMRRATQTMAEKRSNNKRGQKVKICRKRNCKESPGGYGETIPCTYEMGEDHPQDAKDHRTNGTEEKRLHWKSKNSLEEDTKL